MLYDNINTELELNEFVNKLNEISHFERYQIFHYAFETKLLQLHSEYFTNTAERFFNLWGIKVGRFGIYSTTQMNVRNHIENPHLRTGVYEKIYFHLNPADTGISQIAT